MENMSKDKEGSVVLYIFRLRKAPTASLRKE